MSLQDIRQAVKRHFYHFYQFYCNYSANYQPKPISYRIIQTIITIVGIIGIYLEISEAYLIDLRVLSEIVSEARAACVLGFGSVSFIYQPVLGCW